MKNFNKTGSIAHAEDLAKTLAVAGGVKVPRAGRTVPEVSVVAGVPSIDIGGAAPVAPVAVVMPDAPDAPTVPMPERLRKIAARMNNLNGLVAIPRVRLPVGV